MFKHVMNILDQEFMNEDELHVPGISLPKIYFHPYTEVGNIYNICNKILVNRYITMKHEAGDFILFKPIISYKI